MIDSIGPLLEKAVGLHQSGHLAEAIQIYERILAQVPKHFDATHLLGVIALQEGRFERAQDLISLALQTNPRHAAALNNLGMVHLRSGNLELAYRQFERVAKMQPEFLDAQANLGTVLRQLGRPREALVPLLRAHSDDPQSALVCNLIGACFMDTGEPDAAVKFFDAATRTRPDETDGWSNLAIALNGVGEHVRAKECADKALSLRPGSSSALAARAAIEFDEGEIEAAIDSFREAVASPEPSTQTYCAFANALWASARCDEALIYLRTAVAIDGNNVVARWKLAVSECRPFYNTVADIETSRRAFSKSLEELQAWFHATSSAEAYAAVGTTQPFYIAYHPFNNRDLLSSYGRVCSEWMASMPIDIPESRAGIGTTAQRLAASNGKMRIGIASAHIRDHSVWNAITKGWVQHLDRDRFDVWLFQLGRDSDDETAWAKEKVAHFETGRGTVQSWARSIDEARLDALIYPEIGMDKVTTQLASLRLAPVQAASWGHPETTGLPTMDLYLSADGLERSDADGNYSERLVRLPNLGVCVEPLTPTVAVPDFRLLGLPMDEPLLLCPGSPFKYSPAHDPVWAKIAKGLDGGGRLSWARIKDRLRGGGGGRLVFFRSGNVSMDDFLVQRLRRAFDVENVDFDARVRMIPYLARPQFFGLMQRAALLLDTVGFSGFNNALQAVEAGLPVLAHEGAFMRGRLASGIMRRMGMPELVANTDEDFIEKAVALARNASRLSDLRAEIAVRRQLLFHDVEAVRALERCLTQAIEPSRDPRLVP